MNKKRFYHYTLARHLENIQTEGLKPSPAGSGNWDSSLYWFSRQPDCAVWLTTNETAPAFFSYLLGDEIEGELMRITVDLSPNSRHLHHWPRWLQKHMPNVFVEFDTDSTGEFIDEDGWREHWFYEGTIAPSKIVAIDFDPFITEQQRRNWDD